MLNFADRTNHPVEIVVSEVYSEMIIHKSQGRNTVLVLLDLSAAIDTVDHGVLLNHSIILRIFNLQYLDMQF